MLAARPPLPGGPSDSPSPPSHHHPSNTYTAGLPAPPRILIPPPSLNSHDSATTPEWQQPSLSNMVLQPESVLPGTLQDWKYEYRREAQQLLPHLFLGPLSATKDTAFLQKNDITLLLAVRSSMTARARLLSLQLPGIRYESIDVGSNQELISQFQRAQGIIDRHYISRLLPHEAADVAVPLDGRQLRLRQQAWMAARGSHTVPGGRTLLFCESGNERSAVVAAAYIMQHLAGSTIQAVQMVQGKRFCVCFDDSMKWMLTSYEPIWKARSQISDSGGKVKRRLDEDDDDDDEGMGAGRAPFLDGGEAVDVEMA